MSASKDDRKSPARGFVPLVEVRRGDSVESLHFGSIVVNDSRGRVVASAGDPATPVVLRSTAKPAQILPLLDTGAADRFRFSDEAIAVMIGSHGGEEFHVAFQRGRITSLSGSPRDESGRIGHLPRMARRLSTPRPLR